MTFGGLYTLAGRPISRTNLRQTAKMLVYWSLENTDSIALIEAIARNQKKFAANKIQVVAISTVAERNQQNLRLTEIAKKSRGINFLTLVKYDSQSLAFQIRFPIPQVPYLVLLDSNDQIQRISSDPSVIAPFVK